MTAEANLLSLGIELPTPFEYPRSNRTGCVLTGNLLFVSGHPPPEGMGVKTTGKVGDSLDEAEAREASRATALNLLASVRRELGTLDRVSRVVKIFGMVSSAPGFVRQFAVIDGASDLMCEVFGQQAGQHARSAVGMFELPHGICVEIEAVFEVTTP